MSQSDYFLKLDGIDGESTDAKHPSEIVLNSWTFGATNSVSFTGAGAGGGVGKVAFKDFRFTKTYDKASIKLLLACATGMHIKTATITCRKVGATGFEFLVIVLSNVVVTSYDVLGAADASGVQDDAVTLAYAKVELRYSQQSPTGAALPPVTGSFDLTTNKTA